MNSSHLSWVCPELPSLLKKKPSAAKKTVCTFALFCVTPHSEHVYNFTYAALLCSWLRRKVVWVLRRSADRISQSWRRRLKLWTSWERQRNPQPLPKKVINLRNPCECCHLVYTLFCSWVEHFFPQAHSLYPVLQRSVLASRLQRSRAAQKNRGAEAKGIGWKEKRAGWETRDGSRHQKVWWWGGGRPEAGL